MKKNDDVNGSAMLSAVNHQRRLIRLGETLQQLEPVLDKLYEEDTMILGVSIRFTDDEGGDYLVVIRAQKDGERVVAFHAAATFYEAVEGFVNRLTNRSLRWKADEFTK